MYFNSMIKLSSSNLGGGGGGGVAFGEEGSLLESPRQNFTSASNMHKIFQKLKHIKLCFSTFFMKCTMED